MELNHIYEYEYSGFQNIALQETMRCSSTSVTANNHEIHLKFLGRLWIFAQPFYSLMCLIRILFTDDISFTSQIQRNIDLYGIRFEIIKLKLLHIPRKYRLRTMCQNLQGSFFCLTSMKTAIDFAMGLRNFSVVIPMNSYYQCIFI